MKTNSKSEAIILCEKALENIFAENTEMNILPKTNDIITRMLKHQLSLEEVYEEISEKLGESLGTIQAFFEICLRTVYWSSCAGHFYLRIFILQWAHPIVGCMRPFKIVIMNELRDFLFNSVFIHSRSVT